MNGLNLEISSFGNINHANIELNRITVVGGVNDSGKSTASRLLYCFLKSNYLSQKEEVIDLLFEEFKTIPEESLLDDASADDLKYLMMEYEKNRNIINQFSPAGKLKIQNIDSLIRLLNIFDTYQLGLLRLDSQKAISSFINEELIYTEGLIQYEGSSRLYSSNFESFVKIYRTYKYRESTCSSFKLNSCKSKTIKGDMKNSPNVFLIDPFSILNIINHETSDSLYVEKFHGLGFLNHVDSLINDLYDMGIYKSIRYDPIYSEIIYKIQGLLPGHFYSTFFTDDFSLYKEGSYIPTYNTSSGIKQIGIIELLITKEKLKPGSFLIIDEPEANLHPNWQFKFAEILVLLAKEADIKIYMNSHSPMFIEAMAAFIEYYDMEDDVNYYMSDKSDVDENKYDFNKINSNELYKIYENLGNGYELINQLRLRKK